MLYRRGRSGTSTVLGTLIFVGIMFTAVIPMFLVMKQADTLHEIRKHGLEIVDEEKGREYLRVEISPGQGSSMALEVTNKGDLVTKVIRMWINEKDEVRNYILNINDVHEETLGVSEEPDSYSVIVVTEKGNVFVSDSALSHEGYGVWAQVDVYAIHIRIAHDGTIFHIKVTNPDESYTYDEAMVHKRRGGTVSKTFLLDGSGTYRVKITSGSTIIHNSLVELTDVHKSEWIDT